MSPSAASPDVYPVVREETVCTPDCQDFRECQCSGCQCCNQCSEACLCSFSEADPDTKVAQLLGLGSAEYRLDG